MFSRPCKPVLKPKVALRIHAALVQRPFPSWRCNFGSTQIPAWPSAGPTDLTSQTDKERSLRGEQNEQKNFKQRTRRHAKPTVLRPLRKASKALSALKFNTATSAEPFQDSMTTAKSTSLPLSPVIDPNLVQKRAQWKQPKLKIAPATPFEAEIAANPFAQMLATPVRTCVVSDARVPQAFLRPFTLCKDASTDAIWQLPEDLDPSPLEASSTTDDLNTYDGQASGHEPNPIAKSPLKTTLPKSWISSSRQGVDHMARGERQGGNNRNLIAPRWRKLLNSSQIERMRMKDDSADMIQNLLQKRCVRELAALADGGSDPVSSSLLPWDAISEEPEPVKDNAVNSNVSERLSSVSSERPKSNTAVLLWLGAQSTLDESSILVRSRLFGQRDAPILHPVIRTSHNRVLPVLDGETLLGQNALQWLRNTSGVFEPAALLVKLTPASRNALRWLWTLHLY